jgi:hypothetical protein
MAETPEPLAGAIGELAPEGETVDTIAARLQGFPRDAVAEALEMLTAAGVLRKEAGPDGTLRYYYSDPSRYRLADTDVVRRPDGAVRRPGIRS